MSLFSELQAAATESQSILAQMQGMAPAGAGNAILGGNNLTGVWGQPTVREIMNQGGGFRRITETMFAVTRVQFTTPPKSQQDITRTDLTPHQTYRISRVETHDPLFYGLACTKVGE